jgi:hypothetical protein
VEPRLRPAPAPDDPRVGASRPVELDGEEAEGHEQQRDAEIGKGDDERDGRDGGDQTGCGDNDPQRRRARGRRSAAP